MNSMKRITIIGCGGFIGSHWIDRILRKTRWQVIGVDKEEQKIAPFLSHPRFHFEKGDAYTLPSLPALVAESDVVVSLAALCNPALYNTRPLKVIEANYDKPLGIVKECVKSGKWLIQFSTCEVYGKTLRAIDPLTHADGPMNEERTHMVLGPVAKQRWTYSCAKQLLERAIYAHSWENGLNYTIVRPFNFIGPRMDFLPGIDGSGIPRVLACFMESLLLAKPLVLVDGGRHQRVFTYIDDAVDGLMRILDHPDKARNRIFNIGNPENEISIRNLACLMITLFQEITGEPASAKCAIEDIASEQFYGLGYDDCDRRLPDISLARELLNWEPKTGLRETLQKSMKGFVAYYKEQLCLHA